jgi:D-2-hydroxyacid dehydrogenase (NADP+)
MRKLLVIAADQEALGAEPGPHTFKPEHETELRAAAGEGMQIVVATPPQAIDHSADAEAVAAFPMRMPQIGALPHAKWLHSFSAGVDKILTPEVAASDVMLSSSSGIHATPIAEHILACMLMYARGFVKAAHAQRAHEWKKNEALGEFRASSVLIVGLGAIGKEAARLAHQFGARVSAVSRSGSGKPEFVERLEKSERLDEMLSEADYVVITLPGTEETRHLFDKTKFALMKKSAVLINIGRGTIVHEQDLIEALQSGAIAGAGLEVFEKEPLAAESPLWDMENVVITPHHSGLSHRYMDRAITLLCENIRAYIAGNPPPSLVDKSLGY